MNIIILNGSPRKGNTVTAITALAAGAQEAGHNVEILDTYKLSIAPCKGCDACMCFKGCVDKDDTNPVVDKIVAADAIVFASPVYWWGITAQLKLVVDKCYCKGGLMKGKKIGVIATGGSDTTNKQYELIHDQFECICNYLEWKYDFYKKFSASKKEDLAGDAAAIADLTETGKNWK